MSSKLSAKFFEIFRNLKSDAVPRPPRPETFTNPNPEPEVQNENIDCSNQEEVFVHTDQQKKSRKKTKQKKSFPDPSNKIGDLPEDIDSSTSTASSNVNTQAAGNVINIVNSNQVRWGNEIVYYMGPVNGQHGKTRSKVDDDDDDEKEEIEKTDLIQLLLESNEKADHVYLDYISKNLGKMWHRFFRKLGYSQGQIETVEIDMAKYGVAEARYKLLLDWIRNDDYGSLGRLSTVLWEGGERQIVKELAAMYSKNS